MPRYRTDQTKRVTQLFAWVALAVAVSAPASEAQTLKPLTEFKEELRKAGEVSNRVSRVAALMHAGAFESGFIAVSPTFEVHAPAAGNVCIEYVSRNGLYLGSQTFQLDKAGWATVPYPSKLKNVLVSYGAKSLAVHAWSASSCSPTLPAGNETTLPIRSLQKTATDAARFMLLVRSDGYPATVVTTSSDGTMKSVRSTCSDISPLNSVRFDKQCLLDVSALRQGARSQLVVVETDGVKREPLALGF